MSQTAKPASDGTIIGWTPTPVSSRLSAGQIVSCTSNAPPAQFTVKLQPLAWPQAGGQTLTVSLKETNVPPTFPVTVRLLQGSTLIATTPATTPGTSFGDLNLVLSAAQKASISDYANLYVHVVVGNRPAIIEWLLNEGSGTTAYDTGSGSYHDDLTFGGSPTWSASTPGSPAGSGGSILFTSSDTCSGSTVTGIPVGDAARSITFWAKKTSDVQGGVIGFTPASGQRLTIFIPCTDSGGVLIDTGSVGEYMTVAVPSTNVWHLIAVTLNSAGSWVYYLDGTQVSTGTLTKGLNTGALTSVNIGGQMSVFGGITGNVKDVRIYDFVLDSAQVLAINNGTY